MSLNQQKTLKMNRYPAWAPRFWHGMLLSGWLRLVLPRLHRIHPLRWPMALIVTASAAVNSLLCGVQRLFFGRAIAATPIDQPPIFIVGHWRSGTTFLHEMLVLDDQFAFPTTYECFGANHFILTGRLFPKLLGFLLPSKRPQDDMAVSFHHPQEDEFALVSMGAPTPMLRLAFPNDEPLCMEFLDMKGVSDRDFQRWKEAMLAFVRMQRYLKNKPLVLKSPPHTGRIGFLADLFPGARFIHIVRDPYALFPSTQRLWHALERVQAFQYPRFEHLDELVFRAFERMYQGFDEQRDSMDPSRICDVRYEDLVQDPVAELRRIYQHLDLGDFAPVQGKIETYVAERKSYQPAKHELDAESRAAIGRRWSAYMERYGYARNGG
ncbi:MAG: sulfotransferase [Pirellulaceae bacterium]